MPYCPSCGKRIEIEADYCPSCGSPLHDQTQEGSFEGGEPFEKRVEDFAREFEDLGRRTGRAVEREFGRFREDFDHRERREGGLFGVLTPLLYSLVTLLVLVLVVGALKALGAEAMVFDDLSVFLMENLWWMFILVLFFAYTSYLSSRFPRESRWITPATVAVGITAMLWIAAQVMDIISTNQDLPFLETFADWILVFLVPIFILVLLIGYLGLIISISRERYGTWKRYDQSRREYPPEDYRPRKQLYRSSRNKILGGVCGGLGEYMDVDPVVFRIIWIILLFVSFGGAILAYVLMWIVIPRNPHHRWG